MLCWCDMFTWLGELFVLCPQSAFCWSCQAAPWWLLRCRSFTLGPPVLYICSVWRKEGEREGVKERRKNEREIERERRRWKGRARPRAESVSSHCRNVSNRYETALKLNVPPIQTTLSSECEGKLQKEKLHVSGIYFQVCFCVLCVTLLDFVLCFMWHIWPCNHHWLYLIT